MCRLSSTLIAALSLALPLLVGCPSPAPEADPCSPNPCTVGERTVCTAVGELASCSCRAGFEDVGGACVRPGPCASNPCTQPNRGVCLEQGQAAVCACDDGYRDDGQGACVAVQRCHDDACSQPHKSVCDDSQGVVTCSCDVGYRDDGAGGCVSADPCASNPCTAPNRGVCVASGNTAECRCDSGYVDDGGDCVKASACSPNPCVEANRNQCVEATGGVLCECNAGFTLDASGRCVPLDACAPNPCTQPHRGVCTDVGGTAVCACEAGYEDRGGACVQSDPCQPNPCTQPHQTVCTTDANGAAECGCDSGYEPSATGCVAVVVPTCAGQHTTGDSYEPDECPLLATPILSGQPQAHTIAPVGDVDFVSFTVGPDRVVRIEETTGFDASLTLFDTDGVTALQTARNPDRIVRKLAAAGTYYVRAQAGVASATGNTTLALDDLGPDDQADEETGANVVTATTAGTVLNGAFEYPGDWDVVAVPLLAGRSYRFEETSSADVYVRLTTATDTLVAMRDSPESILYRAPSDMTVYFGIRHYSSSATGAWTMRVTDLGPDDQSDTEVGANTLLPTAQGTTLTGAFEGPGDWDVLAVPVQAGRVYRFEEASNADVYVRLTTATDTLVAMRDAPESINWKATATMTVYFGIRLYYSGDVGTWTMRVTDLGPDDQADSEVGANLIVATAAGTTLPGAFEYPLDWDVIAVQVQAGRNYRFEELSGTDVYVRLTTATDTLVPLRDSPESIAWRATATTTVYFGLRAYYSDTLAAWSVRVTDLGPDDQADGETGASVVNATTAGAVVTGAFESEGDWDVLAVPLLANHVYRFDETTSTDVLLRLTAAGGQTLLPAQDQPETLWWKAAATGTVFLGVRHASGTSIGAWSLTLKDLGPDDQADAEAGANVVTPTTQGTELPGATEYPGDWDVIAVPVQAGRIYRFEETTSADVALRLTAGGATLVAQQDEPEYFQWRATTTGTVFLGLRRYATTTTGTWALRLTDMGVDDHGDSRAEATALTVGAAATSGALQFIGDEDWFRFTAAPGTLAFQLTLTGDAVNVAVQTSTGAAVTSGTGPGTLTFSVPSAGDYFVRLTRTTLAAYTIRVSD